MIQFLLQSLLDLHSIATNHGDAQMEDFLNHYYLTEQVKRIKEISDHVTGLRRCGPGLGEYEFGKHSLNLPKV